MADYSCKLTSLNESPLDKEVPVRGIARQVSHSRRVSRLNTFQLLSVAVTEEEDGQGSDECDKEVLNKEVGDNVQLDEKRVFSQLDSNPEDVAEPGRGLPRSNSIGRSVQRPRSSSVESTLSASCDGPMREVFVDDVKMVYLDEFGDERRRSSDITTESSLLLTLEQLVRECEQQNLDQQFRDERPRPEISVDESQVQHDSDQLEQVHSNFVMNRLGFLSGNLKENFVSFCTAIRENLKQETEGAIKNQRSSFSTSNATDSESVVSIDAADTPEELAILASKFHNVNFDAESETIASINSYLLREGLLHHSTHFQKSEQELNTCKEFYNGLITANIAPKRREAEDLGPKERNESLNSHELQAGLLESCATSKAKFDRKGNSNIYDSMKTVAPSDPAAAIRKLLAMDESSIPSNDSSSLDHSVVEDIFFCDVNINKSKVVNDLSDDSSVGSQSLDLDHLMHLGSGFRSYSGRRDSRALMRARLAKRESSGVCKSNNAVAPPDTTITMSKLLAKDESSIASNDSSSLDRSVIGDDFRDTNINKSTVVNDLSDDSSVGSQSLDLDHLMHLGSGFRNDSSRLYSRALMRARLAKRESSGVCKSNNAVAPPDTTIAMSKLLAKGESSIASDDFSSLDRSVNRDKKNCDSNISESKVVNGLSDDSSVGSQSLDLDHLMHLGSGFRSYSGRRDSRALMRARLAKKKINSIYDSIKTIAPSNTAIPMSKLLAKDESSIASDDFSSLDRSVIGDDFRAANISESKVVNSLREKSSIGFQPLGPDNSMSSGSGLHDYCRHHDSRALMNARLNRKYNSDVFSSMKTVTTSNTTTAMSEFLSMDDVSISSVDSASFDSVVLRCLLGDGNFDFSEVANIE